MSDDKEKKDSPEERLWCIENNRNSWQQYEDVCISPFSFLPEMIKEGNSLVPELLQEIKEEGFDRTELWNLDDTIIGFILPRLRAFAESSAWSVDEESKKEEQIIYRAIYQLEKHQNIKADMKFFNEQDYEDFEEALGNLGRILLHLWT